MTTKVAARLMVSVKVAPAMLGPGTTVPEPYVAMGETAWVANAAQVVDDLRTHAGSVWSCVRAHSGRAAPPAKGDGYWLRKGPTFRRAPFDEYINTKARALGALTFELLPGFINGVSVYGPEGDAYAITVRDGPDGPVLREKSGDLMAQAAGLWELLYTTLPVLEKVSLDDIPLSPNAVVSVTVTAANNGPVAVGEIKVGDWRSLIGDSKRPAGVERGASARRRSYTYRRYNDDGSYEEEVRPSSRDVDCTVVLDADQAMYADGLLGEVINMAVPFEATGIPHYGFIDTMGFLSADISDRDNGTVALRLQIRGNT